MNCSTQRVIEFFWMATPNACQARTRNQITSKDLKEWMKMWSNSGPHFGVHIWTQKWGQPSENFAAARTCCASRFATLQLEHECQLIPFSLCASQVRLLLSRSLYRSHVLTTFLDPVLGAMMKQVCWHSRRSKAYRGLPEARGQSEAHGDSNLYNTEEARTCEAWFQLTFRPQKWNLKAHMWYQLSPFPSSNAAIAMQHHPGNIHQSVATPRYSATPWYVLIQLPNVIDTISKRWRSKKAFKTSPFHIFP